MNRGHERAELEPRLQRRGWRLWDEIRQDVRHALRILGRNKRFAVTLVATMAFGVGANTALAGAIDEILWRPLDLPRADELVAVHRVDKNTGRYLSTSYPDYEDLRRRVTTLTGVAGYVRVGRQIDFGDQRVTVGSEWVTDNYFDVLQVRPVAGRTIGPDDNRGHGGAAVVMLAETLWIARFGRDPEVIGRTISLDGEAFEVVGIVPAAFGRSHNLGWGKPPELWLPIATFSRFFPNSVGERVLRTRTDDVLQLIGRLSAGVSARQAEAEVTTIVSSLESAVEARGIGVEVIPAALAKFYPGHRPAYSRQLALIALAGAIVLLLACSNMANLLLERTSRRRQELALRSSLGAGRARLIRQLLTEAVVLAVPGFIASLVVASMLLGLLNVYPAALGVPLLPDLGLTPRIVVLCLLTSLLAAIAFSLVPVLAATRMNLAPAASSRDQFAATGSIGPRLTQGLVVAQVALSTLLLVGALVIARGIAAAYDADLGFRTDRLISVSLSRSAGPRGAAERPPEDVLNPQRWGISGISAIAMASEQPLGVGRASGRVRDPSLPASEPISTDVIWVTDQFFDVVQMPLRLGRSSFGEAPGVVISHSLAERLWGDQNPIGRSIEGAQMSRPAEVIGVAADARFVTLWESRPTVYRRLEPNDALARHILIRTNVPAKSLVPAVEHVWRAISPALPMSGILAGDDHIRGATDSQRLAGRLVAIFSLIALAVASIGLYSTMAWFVERRRREIAIRMALGGSPTTIASRVVMRAGVVAVAGTLLGLATAAALAPQLEAVSRNTSPYDPVAFGVSAAALAVVCFVAALIPALRAAWVDPARTLGDM